MNSHKYTISNVKTAILNNNLKKRFNECHDTHTKEKVADLMNKLESYFNNPPFAIITKIRAKFINNGKDIYLIGITKLEYEIKCIFEIMHIKDIHQPSIFFS
jgi:hypothetical protein